MQPAGACSDICHQEIPALCRWIKHHPAASRETMVQKIPPMDRLLRPAVNVLIGNGATPIEQDIGACLEEIFPERAWRLTIHEAATSHEIFSTVRNERIHLCILMLKSMDCAPPRKAVIGPASALGMIRILR